MLQSQQAKQLFVEALQAARVRHCFDIWAYVIMPEHVHLLIWPRNEVYSISNILKAIKRPFSYRATKAGLARPGHFWKPGGGYDRNLWKTATIHKEIEYLHNNPVRRGLCEKPEDWRYSSAGFWAGLTDVPLAMDGSMPPKEYF